MSCEHKYLNIVHGTDIGHCPQCKQFFANLDLHKVQAKIRRRKLLDTIYSVLTGLFIALFVFGLCYLAR